MFARAHIIVKIDAELLKRFETNNKSVLYFGSVADAELIAMIDNLSKTLMQ